MTTANTETSWGWPARLLHWVMALMILILLGVGTYMTEVEQDLIRRFELTQMHKSFGFVVFVLAIIRVFWSYINPKQPTLPDHMPGWQKLASSLTHRMLYILMFWMPLSGWLMASASPLNDEGAYPVRIANKVFGLFEMPDPFPTGSEALAEQLGLAHWIGALLMALILLMHVGAALKHHFIERDDILRRMTRG